MSKNFIKKLAALLWLAGATSPAFADVIIKGQSTEKVQFYSGTTKTAEIDTTGTLTLPAGKTLANVGGSTPPGMVPLGGMVAVMPNTHANAWQPPVTGVIKDGFMRANGHTITAQNVVDGSMFPLGTTLPNMEGAFAKGASTSNTATAAQKLVLANIPQISTSYTPAGTNAASTISGTAAAVADHEHGLVHSAGTPILSATGGGSWYTLTMPVTAPANATTQYKAAAAGGHSHSLSGTAAAQAFTGTAATITVGTAVDSQTLPPDPQNITVVWVIRVK